MAMTCAHCGRTSEFASCVTCWDAGIGGRLNPRMRVLSTSITEAVRQRHLEQQRAYDRRRAAERREAGA